MSLNTLVYKLSVTMIFIDTKSFYLILVISYLSIFPSKTMQKIFQERTDLIIDKHLCENIVTRY